MKTLGSPDAPIAYQGQHTGARRVLQLTVRRGMVGATAAHVLVDGATYVVPWGSAFFEVPADRPVSVSVHQQANGTGGAAATMLMPDQPPELEYRGPAYLSMTGDLGAPGTVRRRGGGVQFAMLGCLVPILVVLLVLVVVVFALML